MPEVFLAFITSFSTGTEARDCLPTPISSPFALSCLYLSLIAHHQGYTTRKQAAANVRMPAYIHASILVASVHACTLVHTIVLYCMRLRSLEEVILASQMHVDTKLSCSLPHPVPGMEILCIADAAGAYIPYPIRDEMRRYQRIVVALRVAALNIVSSPIQRHW